MNNDKKVEVLLSALAERYTSIHNIRERVQSIGLWVLGIFIGAGGWLIQGDISLNSSQKTIAVLGVLTTFIVIRFFFLRDLENGFKKQLQIASKIEDSLGMYTPGFFNETGTAIYPEEWKRSGTESGKGHFIDSTHILLYVGTIFLLVTIII